jgi:hypothetical protein
MKLFFELLVVLVSASFCFQHASAMAKIGETSEQIRRETQRDKDTVAIRALDFEGRSALEVHYRDGSVIRHLFGTNGREIAFYLFTPKRLTNTDIGKTKRMFRTTWHSMELPQPVFKEIVYQTGWWSDSGLVMAAAGDQTRDYLVIFVLNRADEIPDTVGLRRAQTAQEERSAANAPVRAKRTK